MCTCTNDCHPALFFPSALRDNRIQLHRSTPTELSITISNVELSDEGEYTCSIFTMPVRTARATVTVLGGSHRQHTHTHTQRQRTDAICSQVSEKTKTNFLQKETRKENCHPAGNRGSSFSTLTIKPWKGKSHNCVSNSCVKQVFREFRKWEHVFVICFILHLNLRAKLLLFRDSLMPLWSDVRLSSRPVLWILMQSCLIKINII